MTDQPQRISVLIADDHAIVRRGIRTYLDLQPDLAVVAEVSSGEEAVRLVTQSSQGPDVILMDLLMPGIGGVEAIRQITRISPRTQVIALTSFHQDEHVFAALRAGALSYVLKDIDPEALAEAIRKAVSGESVLHPRVASRVVQQLRGAGGDAPNLFVELSERELEVLRLLAEGLPNAAIAERLVISQKTVKGHVSSILSKLHMSDRTQAAVLAWQQGLIRSS